MGTATENALAFASLGHAVLPLWGVTKNPAHEDTEDSAAFICACPQGVECSSPGKHPMGWLVPNGLHDASLDEAVILPWAEAAPGANWSVRTDGLIVIDQDGPQGATSLRRLEKEHGRLPSTWRVSTGRMQSHHYYFRAP